MVISKIINFLLLDKNKTGFPPVVWRALTSFKILIESPSVPNKHRLVRSLFFVLAICVTGLISTNINIKLVITPIILTALSIFAGFIINLILQTGSQENFEEISLLEMEKVTIIIKDMLKFQIQTFLTYFATISLGVVVYVFPWENIKIIPEMLFLTGAIYSFTRSIILPFQLLELHNYKLDIILRKKKTEEQAGWEKKKNSSNKKNFK